MPMRARGRQGTAGHGVACTTSSGGRCAQIASDRPVGADGLLHLWALGLWDDKLGPVDRTERARDATALGEGANWRRRARVDGLERLRVHLPLRLGPHGILHGARRAAEEAAAELCEGLGLRTAAGAA
eukprot:CAMPEP_0171209106 /NCGR_PEP_ID=MMETSP0790-20130122/28426_1 /TAXON_ID=2925 /ORGANISM="Alexandrium catenella, Strain OF101" /LENGTH=127 /DNA_ID=CAMNT_0011674709 /DNA_START=67 /DNA_END=450 /DNA_ORIENTATION=-